MQGVVLIGGFRLQSQLQPAGDKLMRLIDTAIATVLVVVLASCLMVPNSVAEPRHDAGQFQGLKTEMTSTEQLEAGLDNLTPEQLDYLDRWLRTRLLTTASIMTQVTPLAARKDKLPSATTAPGSLTKEKAIAREAAIAEEVERRVARELALVRSAEHSAEVSNGAFEATLKGDFTGWSGKTRFSLDNGQVWRQRSSGFYRHTGTKSVVRFEQNWFGGWEMTVVDTGKSVLVTRVK